LDGRTLDATGFWVVALTQVVEHLTSKYEALSSNPSTAKKKKKKVNETKIGSWKRSVLGKDK
jgi:5-bromo-4-chloroindolyl phosphate hydrolysis protein